MDKVIEADLYRYGELTGTRGFLKGLSFPGFRFTYILRKLSKCRNHTVKKKLWHILFTRYQYRYGFQIPFNTEIGEGMYISHFGTLVIHEKAKIGRNFTVTYGITIGQTNRGRLKGCPTIGDNVWLGTGVVIVGNVNIGSNVLIAPNSFVNFDVPDHSMVIGNPGRIIKRENPTEGYILSVLEKN